MSTPDPSPAGLELSREHLVNLVAKIAEEDNLDLLLAVVRRLKQNPETTWDNDGEGFNHRAREAGRSARELLGRPFEKDPVAPAPAWLDQVEALLLSIAEIRKLPTP